jgi:hypothetical protein
MESHLNGVFPFQGYTANGGDLERNSLSAYLPLAQQAILRRELSQVECIDDSVSARRHGLNSDWQLSQLPFAIESSHVVAEALPVVYTSVWIRWRTCTSLNYRWVDS